MNQAIYEVVRQFKALGGIERKLVLIDLIEANAIDFNELSTAYVEKLRKERQGLQGANATLGLHLGLYCMKDGSDTGRASRKLLYDTKAYGHNDGSAFGKLLDNEFSNTKADQ